MQFGGRTHRTLNRVGLALVAILWLGIVLNLCGIGVTVSLGNHDLGIVHGGFVWTRYSAATGGRGTGRNYGVQVVSSPVSAEKYLTYVASIRTQAIGPFGFEASSTPLLPLTLTGTAVVIVSIVVQNALRRIARTGACPHCGYALIGIAPAAPCPECGRAKAAHG
ncbi:MAG: hypothetical protein SFY96_04315 [Planctomycetota bacterium]|nr:hypothetical protein [Planctomycetota bacterium]